MKVVSVEPQKGGKYKILLDNEVEMILYRGEKNAFGLKEDRELTREEFDELYFQVLGKRVKKRAMFLLEKMDRTEANLRQKLRENHYPEDLIEEALEYVKSYHYIDDLRYARTYVEYHGREKSRERIRTDLMGKGVARDLIEEALEAEYHFEETDMIKKLLEKKHYDPGQTTPEEQRKLYGFLARKGFKSSDIISAMKCTDYLT